MPHSPAELAPDLRNFTFVSRPELGEMLDALRQLSASGVAGAETYLRGVAVLLRSAEAPCSRPLQARFIKGVFSFLGAWCWHWPSR